MTNLAWPGSLLAVQSGFAGSIPQIYEQYLLPLLFVHYAADLAARVALRQPSRLLEIAAATRRPVEWRQADATSLPFPDETFDVVVCQFGVMFFPGKSKAFSEAKRALRAGGLFMFSV